MIGSSSQNALHLNYIILFLSITWPFICYGFHRSRFANRSDISRKKAHLSPLPRSWSTGKCSVRTIFLSSSEIGSWPRQFPRENCRPKDVRIFVSEESDGCSEGSPISSPFGSDKHLWYQGKFLSVSYLGFWIGIWLDCSFTVYSTLAKPISIVCLCTCTDRDRSNLLLPFYRLNLTV